VSEGKFSPQNEEDIQCFLYHGLVKELDTAIGIRPKATSGKPSKLTFHGGKLLVGNMHFPDLVLGFDEQNPDVVAEIKFRRATRSTFYAGCKRDIEKMKRHHDSRVHYFVLFDANPKHVFLDAHQRDELQSLSSAKCRILHYPLELNTSPLKARSRRAIETMRLAGVDFTALGTENARKAVQGKAKRAKTDA
jgi:hypothetical protein